MNHASIDACKQIKVRWSPFYPGSVPSIRTCAGDGNYEFAAGRRLHPRALLLAEDR